MNNKLENLRAEVRPMADTMTLTEVRDLLGMALAHGGSHISIHRTPARNAYDAIDAAIKQREQTEDIFKWVLSSLVAAVSLLRRGDKQAAPSDKMFTVMLADYEKAIEAGRAVITAAMAKESSNG